ncbi:hypothetical protein HAX54_005371, partial [Datura stramonium]|nr:hypothetical protein [Datura stramonium]
EPWGLEVGYGRSSSPPPYADKKIVPESSFLLLLLQILPSSTWAWANEATASYKPSGSTTAGLDNAPPWGGLGNPPSNQLHHYQGYHFHPLN